MTSKNIFFTSNSHSEIYPANTRSKFCSQIDQNKIDYIDKNNVTAAIKTITFENKFNALSNEYGKPSIIVIQERVGKELLLYEGVFHSLGNLDIRSGKDYYFLTQTAKPYGEGQNFNARNFTDIKLFCELRLSTTTIKKYIVHNIYFHETNFDNIKSFIGYLNYVYKNIELDFVGSQQRGKLFTVDFYGHVTFNCKKKYFLDVLLSKELSEMLGYSKTDLETLSYKSQRDLIRSQVSRGYPFSSNIQAHIFSDNVFTNSYLDLDVFFNLKYFKCIQDKPKKSSNIVNVSKNHPEILGLRTNLSTPDIFKNECYDTQIVFFNVKDVDQGVQIHSINNPSFFSTSLEKLSNASFELIDIKTGITPNFSVGTPSFIHMLVGNNQNMTSRFNMFLDSSDENSKKYYPQNNSVDFTIKLPERLEFDKKWEVTLKSIFVSNDLYNIYKDSCWIKVRILQSSKRDLSGQTLVGIGGDETEKNIFLELENGIFRTLQDLCKHIQSLFDKKDLKLKIEERKKKIQIRCLEERISPLLINYDVILSPSLSNILGFDTTSMKEHKLNFEKRNIRESTFSPNIFMLIPTNFIIMCNIVGNSVFGGVPAKILKIISSNFQPDHEIIKFSFYQDELVDLDIKEFSSIQIKIVDTTGSPIKLAQSFPTRCQIQFIKKI